MNTPSDYIMPIIHLNGTSGEQLRDDYLTALNSVRVAIHDLLEIEFNARDYYPHKDPEAYQKARKQYTEMHQKLCSVADELTLVALHCDQFCKH